LLPEKGENWEVGVTALPRRALVEIDGRYFQRLIQDQIAWVQNSPNTSKAVNLARIYSTGVEGEWRATVPVTGGWQVRSQGSATWLRSLDRGSETTYVGKVRPQTPSVSAWQRVEWSWQRRGLLAALFWQSRWRSALWRDRANREQIPIAETQDVGVRFHDQEESLWRAELALRNLLDRTNYDFDRYPLPRRGIYLQLGIDL